MLAVSIFLFKKKPYASYWIEIHTHTKEKKKHNKTQSCMSGLIIDVNKLFSTRWVFWNLAWCPFAVHSRNCTTCPVRPGWQISSLTADLIYQRITMGKENPNRIQNFVRQHKQAIQKSEKLQCNVFHLLHETPLSVQATKPCNSWGFSCVDS